MESLYTKYRPQTFADVVGQTHVVTTLEHAVIEGRTSHAYLFCGPRGTGKTTMARLLAKALMCEQGEGHLPDGTCDQCRMIAAGEHPDVYELDAASRTGVDNVRDEIISRVSFAPVQAPYKMYIIDEVHMLTTAAFNALLKTLEEPPAHVVFVLCTTDPQKIPETILSRVQRFDFHAISNADIQGRLAYICEREGFGYDPEALELVVRHARGGMRDAISELEQLSVSGGGSITVDVARDVLGEVSASTLERISLAMANRDVPTLFAQVESLVEVGRDLLQFTRALAARLRDVYVVAAIGASSDVVMASDDDLPAISREAKAFGSVDRVARALALLSDASTEMRVAPNQRLVLEVALTKIARPQAELTLDALADRVASLEKQVVALSMMETRRTTEVPKGVRGGDASLRAESASAVRVTHGQANGDAGLAQETARAAQRHADASGRPGTHAAATAAEVGVAHEQPAQTASRAQRGASVRSAAEASGQSYHGAAGVAGVTPPEGTVQGGSHTAASTAVTRAADQAPQGAADAADGGVAQGVSPEQGRGLAEPTAQPTQQVPATGEGAQRIGARQPAPDSTTLSGAASAARPAPATQGGQGPASQYAPTNQPAQDAPAAQSAAVTDKGELQRRWKQVVDGLLASHPQHGALLMNSTIVADDGYQLTVSFPKGSLFACRMLDRPDVRASVDPMIEQVFGPRKARFGEGVAAPAAQAGPAGASVSAPRTPASPARGGRASARDAEAPAQAQRSEQARGLSQAAAASPAGSPASQSRQATSAKRSGTASAPHATSPAAPVQTTPSYRAPWETEAAAQPGAPSAQPWQTVPTTPAETARQPRQVAQQVTPRPQATQPAPMQAQSSYPAPWEAAPAPSPQETPRDAAGRSVPLDDDMVPYDDLDASPYEEEFAFGDVPESLSQVSAMPAAGAQSAAMRTAMPAPGMLRGSDAALSHQATASHAAHTTAGSRADAGQAPARVGSDTTGAASPASPLQGSIDPAIGSPSSHVDAAGSRNPQPSTGSAAAMYQTGARDVADAPQTFAEKTAAVPQSTGARDVAESASTADAVSTNVQQQTVDSPTKPRRTRRPAAAIPADIIAMMADIFGEGVTYTSIEPDDQEDELAEELTGEDAAESEFVDEPVDDADYDEDE